jgi:hypothetical protein
LNATDFSRVHSDGYSYVFFREDTTASMFP